MFGLRVQALFYLILLKGYQMDINTLQALNMPKSTGLLNEVATTTSTALITARKVMQAGYYLADAAVSGTQMLSYSMREALIEQMSNNSINNVETK